MTSASWGPCNPHPAGARWVAGAGARAAGGGGRGRGRCLGKEAQLAAGGVCCGSGSQLKPQAGRREPLRLPSGRVVAGIRAAGARAPRPPVMVGHLHLQAMGDTREQSRDGLLDSPDSGLPPSPSPSPPFYALSPGTLDSRAATEPPGHNEVPAVRRGDPAVQKAAWSLPSSGRHEVASELTRTCRLGVLGWVLAGWRTQECPGAPKVYCLQ